MRALWRASIWHRGAIPRYEWKYAAPLKRVVFPLFNLAMIVLGAAGVSSGFQAVRDALPGEGPAVLYIAFIVGGIVCMIGCAFPRLWTVEIAGKIFVLGVLGVLIVAMLAAASQADDHPGVAVAVILVVLSMFPILRLWILGVEWAGRHPREDT